MKLRNRLNTGFGIVLVIMCGLGLASYGMFRDIGRDLNQLNAVRLAAAQDAVTVERLALEAEGQQREYFVTRDSAAQSAAERSLGDAMTKLQEIAELARRNYDDGTAATVNKACQSVVDCRQWFDRGVASLDRCRQQETCMDTKGLAIAQEAVSLSQRKKAEYVEARDSLAIANNINASTLEMRFFEKSYMLEHDALQLAGIERDVNAIVDACGELEKRHPNEDEKKQIALARDQAKVYLQAARAWAEQYKQDAKSTKMADLAKTMARSGDALSQTVDDYTVCKQGTVEKTAEAQFAAQEIGQLTLNCRLAEKAFLTSRNSRDWESMTRAADSLRKELARLEKLAIGAEDKTQIQRASKAATEYRAAANDWSKEDSQLREGMLPRMRDAGQSLIASARDVQKGAWKSSLEVSNRIFATTDRATATIVVCLVVAITCGMGLAWRITRSITRPLHAAIAMLKDIAEGEGDLTQRLPVASRDEIGELAQWFNTFVDKLRDTLAKVSRNTVSLSASSQQLSATASQLSRGAETTTQQSTAVAAATEEMSANMRSIAGSSEQVSVSVKSVAAAMEEMTASFTEVAGNAERAASVAGEAAQLVDVGHLTMTELVQAAEVISKVTTVIQDIAEQTSLLALNATIEAARAGEAGKGFAVVATEVKELARQTNSATEDIRARVEGMQASTSKAASAIDEVGKVIRQVNDVSRNIASAVEEQSVTAKEIAKNVAQASAAVDVVARGVAESAAASQEITRNISGVNEAAKQSALGAAQTMDAGGALERLAGELQGLVGQFQVGDTPANAA